MLSLIALFVFGAVLSASSFSSRADSIDDCLERLIPPDAIAACTEALAISSLASAQRAIILSERATAYTMIGEVEAARADFGVALAADPNNVRARYGRGTLALGDRDYAAAIADFDAAIATDPTYMPSLHNRGVAYEKLADYPKAIADFTAAIALEPALASSYNNRGVAYSKSGELKHAIADFDRAIALSPRYAQAFANRGLANSSAGRLADAVADFRAALAIDAQNQDARTGLDAIPRPAGPVASVPHD